MRWFGESWEAPLNESVDQTEVPVGEPCVRCQRLIEESDQGLLIPHLGEPGVFGAVERPFHLHCWMKELGIPREYYP